MWSQNDYLLDDLSPLRNWDFFRRHSAHKNLNYLCKSNENQSENKLDNTSVYINFGIQPCYHTNLSFPHIKNEIAVKCLMYLLKSYLNTWALNIDAGRAYM